MVAADPVLDLLEGYRRAAARLDRAHKRLMARIQAVGLGERPVDVSAWRGWFNFDGVGSGLLKDHPEIAQAAATHKAAFKRYTQARQHLARAVPGTATGMAALLRHAARGLAVADVDPHTIRIIRNVAKALESQ